MRLLITGASGLLGSKMALMAVMRGHDTYAGHNRNEALAGIPTLLDICNRKAVERTFEETRPEAVVHAAALTNVDMCEQNKDLARRVNVEGTQNLIESSEHHETLFVYVSTDYVFSGESGMYSESDDPNPVNTYGLTKLEAEKAVRSSSLEWCIARPSVIYGAAPSAGRSNFALWIINSLQRGESIKIITDQWVSPTLNTNLAEMLLEIVDRRLTGTYHISGETRVSRYDFSVLIADAFHFDRNLIIPAKAAEMQWIAERPRDSSLDVSKATRILRNGPLNIDTAIDRLSAEIKQIRRTNA